MSANGATAYRIRPCRPRPWSFTLIELVTVVTIIAIMASIAVPRFANFIAVQRAESAARRIALDMNMTRRRAQQASTSYVIIFDTNENTYRIAGLPSMDHAGEEYIVDLDQPPYQVDITAADFGGNAKLSVTGFGDFDSDGQVRIQAGPRARRVVVEATTGGVDIQ